MVKQIRFRDKKRNGEYGGLLIDNEYIICGCCGCKFNLTDPRYEIIEEYDTWVNLTETITGE